MEKTKEKPSTSKTILDYSNTIVYKITCNDTKVPDKYVGHTIDFVKRKYAHKHTTTNIKSDSYNLKLYVTIRENGGWSNWHMEIVGFYNCLDLHEAKIKEQEHFVSLNATLNSIEPVPTRNEKIVRTIPINEPDKINVDKQYNLGKFICKSCDYKCCKPSEWTKHTLTRKHLGIEYNGSEKSPKFTCEKCDVTCFKLSKWNRHILTIKHLNGDKRSENIQTEFACKKCNKKYKSRSSVWYHETKCNLVVETSYTGIIERLLIDNVELRKLIVDQTKTTSETMNKTIETIMTQNAEIIETIMTQNAETMSTV